MSQTSTTSPEWPIASAKRLTSLGDVPTGVVATTRGGILSVHALGSCIAVMALDAVQRIGGIAHVMLPDRAPVSGVEQPTRYAANGIEELISALNHLGTTGVSLTIFLVGAGNVLKRDDDTVCQANIESVVKELSRHNLPVLATALGGDSRRTCSLDAGSGRVLFSVGDSPRRILWEREMKI